MIKKPFVLPNAPHGPIYGDVVLPQEHFGSPVVIGVHGFKGFKDWGFWPDTARMLAEAGFVAVTYNVSGSGVGESGDTFTELDRFEDNTISKELSDLGSVIDAVVSREIPTGQADTRRLGVLGHSRGGGVSLVRASRDPRIQSLVLWNPVSSFLRISKEDRTLWREQGFMTILNARTQQRMKMGVGYLDDLEIHGEAHEPLAGARRLRASCLFISGAEDESVPPKESEDLRRAVTVGLGKREVIPATGHTFGAAHPPGTPPDTLLEAFRLTREWFQKALSVTAS